MSDLTECDNIAIRKAVEIGSPSLAEADCHTQLIEWNQTVRAYPRDKCVHEVFEEQAKRTPEGLAVLFEGQSLSYGDLNDKANRLAFQLRALGVAPGELVGLRIERSFEMIIGLLGILKAGGAYWALEENVPDERLRFMLGDARPRALLIRKNSVHPLPETLTDGSTNRLTGTCSVAAIEDLLELSPEGGAFSASSVQAGDPAYVSYTSGSTGQPKGVVTPHRGVVRLVKGIDYVSLTPDETLLHLSPLAFDASTFELWGALLNGGCVALLSPGPTSLADIGRAIRTNHVTTVWLTAGLFHLMVDERVEDLKPLRQLLSGGDVLSPDHVIKARRALPNCRIVNGYGPTENTTFTCCYTVEDERELTPSVPIGRPIANTRVYVLDAEMQPTPIGVEGELYVGGDGVACGYLRQPQQTAERFVADPFSTLPGARLFRTGDRARWRADGNLEFLGRLDFQVKIHGHRVELGEIENALRAQPDIRDAAVIVCEGRALDKRLVAYLIAEKGEKRDAAQLRGFLADKLPGYMMPSAFVWLEQMPLMPSGKVDRRALPAPERSGGEALGDANQPANLLELELTRIWRRLFQREDVGRHDDFFAMGGCSLLAVQLATAIGDLLGPKLPISALFQSPTIESLARRLAKDNWAPAWSSLVPLQPLGSKPPLFFLHGCFGDVYVYMPLAKLLPCDQPSYGVQAVGQDGTRARHTSVEEMAAHYVKEIRSLQPDGPYYLAGFSLGGNIAFEVAQQLSRAGQRVALLALLDSEPIGPITGTLHLRVMVGVIRDRFLLHLRSWRKLPPGEWLQYIRERVASLRHLARRNRSKPPAVTSAPPIGSEAPEIPGFTDYYHAVASTYRMRPYPNSVEAFESDDTEHVSRRYWKCLARGGVVFHRVPGGHMSILQAPDCLPVLAKSFTIALHRAQEREGQDQALP